jgi:hypothetical protein
MPVSTLLTAGSVPKDRELLFADRAAIAGARASPQMDGLRPQAARGHPLEKAPRFDALCKIEGLRW